MSYISDTSTFKDLSRTTGDDLFMEISGDISGKTSGPELTMFSKMRMRRMEYKFRTPFETFVDALKNPEFVKKHELTSQELEFMVRNMGGIVHINFKNPAGLLYAYRYYKIFQQSMGKEDLLELVQMANMRDVPTFDIIRYYRLLVKNRIVRQIDNVDKLSL